MTLDPRIQAYVARFLALRPDTSDVEVSAFQTALQPYVGSFDPARLDGAVEQLAAKARHVTVGSVRAFVDQSFPKRVSKKELKRRQEAAIQADIDREQALRDEIWRWETARADDDPSDWKGRSVRVYPGFVDEVYAEWRAAGRGGEDPSAGDSPGDSDSDGYDPSFIDGDVF